MKSRSGGGAWKRCESAEQRKNNKFDENRLFAVDILRKIPIISLVVADAVRQATMSRADSSAGEHLPYTQGVVGSKPIPPTKSATRVEL